MSDDLMERIEGCIANAEHGDEWATLIDVRDRIEALEAENERLREVVLAYTEYCGICHGRGSIIEEDAVTGADLWRDCPGCGSARAALEPKP